MNTLKAIFKFILFHRWNRISSENLKFLDENWNKKPKKGFKKLIYNLVFKINGYEQIK